MKNNILNKIISILLIILIANSFFIFGNVNANNINENNFKKTSILYKLEKYIDRLDNKEKKDSILNNSNLMKFLNRKIGNEEFDRFAYDKYLRETDINNISINTDNNTLELSFNRFGSHIPKIRKDMKEKFREDIIKELVKKYPNNVKKELQRFIINITKDGKLDISENIGYVGKVKKDKIEYFITESFYKKGLKFYTYNNKKNTYYNYLDDKTIKGINIIDLDKLKDTLIFRNIDDIEKYLVVNSYRYREKYSRDRYYRRFNINQIYKSFHYIEGINPGETISFNDFYLKDENGKKFMEGAALIDGKEEKTYGGGVCGAATGIYQGSLSNGNLTFKRINHSAWYPHGYEANIDGKYIKTPGLDSTYFGTWLDLKITNNSKYPVFIGAHIDGRKVEKNYTLSFKWDYNKVKINFIKRSGKCFYWKRGEETIRSCYQRGT